MASPWQERRAGCLVCFLTVWTWVQGGCDKLPEGHLAKTPTAEALPEASDARRLQDITTPLPLGLTVTIGDLPGIVLGEDLDVVAGVNYTAGIRLALVGQYFSQSLDGVAKLRLVSEGTVPQRGECSQVDNYWPGGIGFNDSAIALVVDNSTARSAGPVSFMLGGHYRICYSHDGTFGSNSELLNVPQNLKVRGSKINCKADSCLEEYRWYCFTYRDQSAPAGSCTLNLDYIGYTPNTSATSLSWGPTVQILLGEVVGWSCGSAPSAKLVSGYQPPVAGSVGREFAVSPLGSTGGFSVQACYCPAYDGCDADSDFVQPVGRIHFFYSRICDDAACSNELSSAYPGSPFALHIDCAGTAACSDSVDNRVKVIDSSVLGVNDRPSWMESTGCRSAVQSSAFQRPSNCEVGQVAQCGGPTGAVNGGTKRELKVFEEFVLGPADFAGFPISRSYDICYCDEGCNATQRADAAARFRKVGQVLVRPFTLTTFRESGMDTGIRVVGMTGDLMVDGRGNIPLAPRPAQVKILWDNLRQHTDEACAASQDLVAFSAGEGPVCLTADSCSHKASTLETNPPNGFLGSGVVVHFNDGGTQGERITFSQAGIVAICYCGVLSDGSALQESGACLRDDGFSHWILIARTVIRGPCVLSSETQRCEEESWTFYTGIPFRLTLRGIGLKSSDKVRIIPQDGQCKDNVDGGGEETVLKGCPHFCSPLNLPDTSHHVGGPGKDDIDIQITSWDTVACNSQNSNCSTARLLEVLPASDHTIWRFEADPGLANGDVVVLHNVTGGTAEENALVEGHAGIEPLGWPITRTDDPLLIRVPAHVGQAYRQFTPGGGWHRHNVASSSEELKGTAAKSLLQVCWGSGPDTYHARAGRISFVEPSSMSSAVLAISALEGGRWAPAVVAFMTSSGGDSALRYKLAANSMQLRLSFNDVAKAEPLLADVDGQPLPEHAPPDHNELQVAQQVVCGMLFLELWSDDDKGFPLPRGCYYRSLAERKSRDVYVVFEPKSGLEPGRRYQLVLNVLVAVDASTVDQVLSVYSLDDVELMPYGVVEVGDARLSRNPKAASGVGEPRFMFSDGLTVLDPDDDDRKLVELTTNPASLLLRLRGDGRSRITPGSQLRVFLWPLTVWDLHATCQADCLPHRTLVCGTIPSCSCAAVVDGAQRNMIHLQLPTDMTEIYGTIVQHTVRVSELLLPSLGFFGTRFGAQISTPDDSRVHYVESSGALVWKAASTSDPQATVASIITREGDGNDRPFRGDAGNTLYVRLALGASLRAELYAGDASFKLTLPSGFICRGVAAAPSSLLLFDGVQPQGRGSLPASAGGHGGGSWHQNGRTCEYRLASGELLPAQSRIFLQLTIDQPDHPLQKANILNRWFLELSSKGWYRWSAQQQEPFPFVEGTLQDGQEGDLSANVPLLGKLGYANLQPSNFKAGASGNVLQVFFQPEQATSNLGSVLVAAPVGFSFVVALPDECRVSRLPDVYYRKTAGIAQTLYLPAVASCIASCSAERCPGTTLNRAAVSVKNSLQPENVYGFRVELTNRPDYAPGDEALWSIATSDASGHKLDASYPSARFNPAIGGTSRAWSVYAHDGDLAPATLQVSSLLPTAMSHALSSVTVSGVQLPTSVETTCRFMAPDGFHLSPLNFLGHYSTVPGAVTASWPGGTPWQSFETNPGRSNSHGDQAKNVLLWDQAAYSHAEQYGFVSKLRVPGSPVVRTSSTFFLQFGWDATTLPERIASFALPVPPVRAITDFTVHHVTNLPALSQLITIVLETSAAIPVYGKLQLRAPAGFVFEERCQLVVIPGDELPLEALECESFPDAVSQSTVISLTATSTEWPNGRLAFGLHVRNPPEPRANRGGQATSCGYEHCWTVHALDERGVATEMQSATQGFAINRHMFGAKLVDLSYDQRVSTGRNDRPGRPNNLLFAFRLNQRPASVGTMVLSAPRGFSFEEDCLPGLRLDDGPDPDSNVFGYLGWIPGYSRWEVAARVESCVASGPAARIRIALGLRAARVYVFRIHIAANPVETPDPNLWRIEYAGESSTPFEGFPLWTFTEYSLTPTVAAASTDPLTTANPVVFRFRPYTEVPADRLGNGTGGLLRITAPTSIQAATVGADCAAYHLVGEQGAFAESIGHFKPGRDVQCWPGGAEQPHILSFQLTGSMKLEANGFHELTAQFYNPRTAASDTGPWVVTTFNNPSGTLEAALDATSFSGFAITPHPLRWVVALPTGEQHAGAFVGNVSFEVAFTHSLAQGDKIRVTAPAGFDLAAQRQCFPQVGKVLGGTRQRVGFSATLQHCAELVWREAPDATASSWNVLDRRCFAHLEVSSLELCAPPLENSTSEEQCSAYHVCAFAGTNRECHDFRPSGGGYLLASPRCEANAMLFRLEAEDTLPGGVTFGFTASTRNPSHNPNLTQGFWIVEQYGPDNLLQTLGAAEGWPVIPELAFAAVRLTGSLQAAGTVSQLTVEVVPTSDAEQIELVAVAPPGFDFSEVTVTSAGHGVAFRETSAVTVNCALSGGTRLDPALVLDNVRIGSSGSAVFRLGTFRQSVKVDESLSIAAGATFFVPGRIEVLRKQLSTAHHTLPVDVVSLPAFQPRAGDLCLATFELSVGAPTVAGDVLWVSADPFSFQTEDNAVDSSPFELFASANHTAVVRGGSRIGETGTAVHITLHDPLKANEAYTLKMLTWAGPHVGNNERWRFQTRRGHGQELPVNTNDDGTEGFTLVHMVKLSMSVGRVAPGSSVVVEVTVEPGDSLPDQLILWAPVGFSFPPQDCLQVELGPRPQVLACRRLAFEHVVELQLAVQRVQGQVSTEVTVRAPAVQDPAVLNSWFVQAQAQTAELGWGEAEGFLVQEMELGRLVHPGAPGAQVHVAVIFHTTQGLFNGGVLELQVPEAYALSCHASAGFRKLSILGVQHCSVTGSRLLVVLNETLPPGDYAFTVGLTNPVATPPDNRFSIVLRDVSDNVVDARMHFNGQRIVEGLNILPSSLSFNASSKFAHTEIQVSLRLTAPIDPLEAIGPVRALQIALPERFTLITREKVINIDGLPTPETGWSHLFYMERLIRIDFVRNVNDTPAVIPTGEYRVSFQVRLPEFWMPSVNVWVISLCRDLRCSHLLADIPIAGFDFGDSPTGALDRHQAGNAEDKNVAKHGQRPFRLLVWSCVALFDAAVVKL